MRIYPLEFTAQFPNGNNRDEFDTIVIKQDLDFLPRLESQRAAHLQRNDDLIFWRYRNLLHDSSIDPLNV